MKHGDGGADTVPGLRWRIRLTLSGMLAERIVQSFWPAWCALLATYVVWKCAPLTGISLAILAWIVPALLSLVLAVRGAGRIRAPRQAEAIRRMDAELPGQPLSALSDRQVAGLEDAGSRSLWNEHLARMARQAGDATAAEPDFRLAASDRWSLRYIAATATVIAFLFLPKATGIELTQLAEELGANARGDTRLSAYDAWVEPPAYTGEPGIYLNEIAAAEALPVPVGSRLSVRTFGSSEDYAMAASVTDSPVVGDAGQEWTVERDGFLELSVVDGQQLRWNFIAVPDMPPSIEFLGEIEAGPFGKTTVRLGLEDDYGTVGADLVVKLDLAGVRRIHGLALEPEVTSSGRFRVQLPFGPQQQQIETEFSADFGDHPWAGLPVEFVVNARDAAGQSSSRSMPIPALPGRIVVSPVARALVEQRRDLLWNRENGSRAAKVIRAISHAPDDVFKNVTAYLATRISIRMLETAMADGLDDRERDSIADLLWRAAMELEEGDLAFSREMLSEAARRLSDAIRRGAPDSEISRLQEEYRQALERFIAEMARMAQGLGEDTGNEPLDPDQFEGELREFSMSRIQQLMDELNRLLEEGRTAEAGRVLDELRRLTENMVAVQPGRSGPNGEFQQSMRGFGGTLQRQQGLADEAFRDLQEQRMQEGAGASEGNVGGSGGLGRGQDHFGQGERGAGEGGTGELAERQETLRQELRRQMRQLADQGLDGRDAINAFERAARAMTRAREGLRRNDHEGALVDQSEAIEALGEGIRALDREFAAQSGEDGYGGPPGTGSIGPDPLGRRWSGNAAGVGHLLVPDELMRRRSQELRDEIRRRVGEQDRPDFEREYLMKLLEIY